MSDIECPYCGNGQEIDHEDGAGYDENTAHNQECHDCGKTFIFYTDIMYCYTPKMAPCLNGEPHDWRPRFPYMMQCWLCEEQRKMNVDEKIKHEFKL